MKRLVVVAAVLVLLVVMVSSVSANIIINPPDPDPDASLIAPPKRPDLDVVAPKRAVVILSGDPVDELPPPPGVASDVTETAVQKVREA